MKKNISPLMKKFRIKCLNLDSLIDDYFWGIQKRKLANDFLLKSNSDFSNEKD